MPYGKKMGSSAGGRGGSKLGPKGRNSPSQVKSPKQPKAKTTFKSDYKKPTASGSSKAGSTRTAYGDKGASKTSTKSGYKAPAPSGSKSVSSHANKTTGKGGY